MASTKEWFESVAEAERRAARRLPPSVHSAILAGAERGTTYHDNIDAFGELGLLPRIATGVPSQPDLATSVLGMDVSMPVLISPAGVQAVHPDAEVAIARAAAQAGIAGGLSSFASRPVEDVVAANPGRTLFQVYWMGSRERMAQILERARAAGASGIILTLDWVFAHRRDWGSPAIPERLDVKAMLKLAPEAARRPRWLLDFARAGGPPDLTAPNMAAPGQPAPPFFGAYGEWMMTGQPTWDDVAWLRAQWDGPFMVKGVARAEDALRAIDAGADAISVSNHGGNNVDGAPASIRVLPSVVEAVDGRIEVLLDGGIRRGSDVVKALALGARAVMVGRAVLWGLAANGQAGVTNVLEILRAGMQESLVGLGRASAAELSPADVLVPRSFVPDGIAVVEDLPA